MSVNVFVHGTRIDAPAEEVFRWHARPGALERLTPPWTSTEILERTGGIENGARVVLRIRMGPARVRWIAEHRDFIEGRQFRDVQITGPFARWEHTHRFEPLGPKVCHLEDRIDYELPLGACGSLLGRSSVRRTLARMFAYRHRITAQDLATHIAYQGSPMHILVSGSTGLIGSALASFLTTGGHRVTRLVRTQPTPDSAAVQWDPARGVLGPGDLNKVDAIVHLAGENIAGRRWTDATKARIRESRIKGTRLLCLTLAKLSPRPRVLISASAVGYYGDRGAEELNESSHPGSGFLAGVCREWEAATAPAIDSGMRVVHLRTGVVLSAAGGALAKILLPFRLGAGGRIGSGKQYMSWISLDDLAGVVLHALRTETIQGAVNVVTPHPVTNLEFTKILGRVLGRPTILPVPAAAARLAFGEMAEEMLLASTRALPSRLVATGYAFRHPRLEDALRHTLGR